MVRRILSLLLLCSLLIGLLSGCKEETSMPVVDSPYPVDILRIGNQSLFDYQIVLPKKADITEQNAANFLVKYIAQATGKTLTFAESADKAIYIGGYPDEVLGKDGFDIKVVDGDLIISGNHPRGTLYGVFTFLEEYIGCRWYTKYCERILEQYEIVIPTDLNDRQIPVFQWRYHDWGTTWNAQELAAKHKLNLAEHTDRYSDIPGFGGRERYVGGFSHTLDDLVPWEVYQKDHPDWFSGTAEAYQPCLTKEGVYQVVINRLRELLKTNPNATIANVTLDDNYNSCQCVNCSQIDLEEGSQSGTLIRFVNRIAAELAPEYPNLNISTFAYHQSLVPPKITKPLENVQIRFCPIHACAVHNLEDETCSSNVEHVQYLKQWAEISDNLAIWDYCINYFGYNDFYPDFDSIYYNMQLYADLGVQNIFYEAMPITTGEFGELRGYVISKLAWDPYIRYEEYQAIINDFMEGYYGPGWEAVRYYFDIGHQRAKESGVHVFCHKTPHITVGITNIDIYEIKSRWATAMELANVQQKQHLERTLVSVLLAEAGNWLGREDSNPNYDEAVAIAQKYNLQRGKRMDW